MLNVSLVGLFGIIFVCSGMSGVGVGAKTRGGLRSPDAFCQSAPAWVELWTDDYCKKCNWAQQLSKEESPLESPASQVGDTPLLGVLGAEHSIHTAADVR